MTSKSAPGWNGGHQALPVGRIDVVSVPTIVHCVAPAREVDLGHHTLGPGRERSGETRAQLDPGPVETDVVVGVEHHRNAGALADGDDLCRVPDPVVVLEREASPHRLGECVDPAEDALNGLLGFTVAATEVKQDDSVRADAHGVEQRCLDHEIGDGAFGQRLVRTRQEDVLRRVGRHPDTPELFAKLCESLELSLDRTMELGMVRVRGVRHEIAGDPPVTKAAGAEPRDGTMSQRDRVGERRARLPPTRVVRRNTGAVRPEHLDGETQFHACLFAGAEHVD